MHVRKVENLKLFITICPFTRKYVFVTNSMQSVKGVLHKAMFLTTTSELFFSAQHERCRYGCKKPQHFVKIHQVITQCLYSERRYFNFDTAKHTTAQSKRPVIIPPSQRLNNFHTIYFYISIILIKHLQL